MTTPDRKIISHLYQSEDNTDWVVQTNEEHCCGVADMCSDFASSFGMSSWGRLIGLMHDRGKEKADFQKYIRVASGYDCAAGSYGDKSHAIIGALIAEKRIGKSAYLLSNCIAGHHRGLYDIDSLRLELEGKIPPEVSQEVPQIKPERIDIRLSPTDFSHLTRALFSCLVDADYLDTERFMKVDDFEARGKHCDMPELKLKLDKALSGYESASPSSLNRLRSEIQKYCIEAASRKTGFFELTVPTGGGKTIASVAWAINHAIAHKKKRIIIAIPYTSIIVQTAQVLRNIFGEENVLEHHSVMVEDNLGRENKLASENWDVPIVVTTNVQLFESMFSNKPGKCRKLHSVTDSVVILDEAQSLPMFFLQPIVNAMQSYVRLFGVSFLFCTASQPILSGERKGLGSTMFHGIGKDSIYKIIPGDWELHDKFRRVKIAIPKKSENIESIVERIKSHSRVLCVVNTRSFASKIFNLLPSNESNVHLSRMMCPAHIADTIASIKRILKTTANPIRVVSTQLIEAGVDIDFPVVFRQLSGLDSIVQAAGRCNREGLLPEATTYVFDVGGERSYGSTASAINAMREMMSIKQDADWLSPATMTEYYRILYSKTASFDKQGIESRTNSLGEIAYEDIAKRFRLIDEEGIPVIVNYGKSPSLVARLKDEGPSRTLMRQLSLFTVTVRKRLFDGLRNAGLITEPRNGIYYIGLKEQYDSKTGLNTINEYTEQIYII